VQGTLTAGEHHLSRSICLLWMGTVVVCSAFGGAINLGPAHRGRWRTSRPPFASRLQRLRPGTAMQSRAGVCPAGRVRRIRDSNSCGVAPNTLSNCGGASRGRSPAFTGARSWARLRSGCR
jgi:hypothetical protein